MSQLPLTLTDFAGHWRLTRVIDDHRARAKGHFTGAARLTATKTGLDYSETGTLTLPGARPMQAERRYLWSETETCIAVAFDDGRPFHSFTPGGSTTAAHWCDPDQYDVAYDFQTWPAWTSTWTVTGPRKDYTMRTTYTRPE